MVLEYFENERLFVFTCQPQSVRHKIPNPKRSCHVDRCKAQEISFAFHLFGMTMALDRHCLIMKRKKVSVRTSDYDDVGPLFWPLPARWSVRILSFLCRIRCLSMEQVTMMTDVDPLWPLPGSLVLLLPLPNSMSMDQVFILCGL